MSFEVSVCDGLAGIPAREWDRLAGAGQGGLRHSYLTAWEQVDLEGLVSRPIVAREPGGGEIVAATPGYFYDLDVTRMTDARVESTASVVRRAWPRFAVARVYELGCPTALCGPFLREAGVDAAATVVPAALAEADRGGADVVIVEDCADGADSLEAHGFQPLPIMPTLWLELPFTSFDGYLDAMRAQYRRRARKVLRRSARLEVERLADFSQLAPELARLSRDMFERAQEVKRELLGERFFVAASERDELDLMVLRRGDGSIAAFALLLDDSPWLRFLACGFERAAGEREAAYFRLLYEIVRAGIDDGFERVDFGVTTLAPKLDTGAVPVPLVAWLRHRNSVVQRVFAGAARRVVRPVDAQPRNVFKTPALVPA